MLSAILGALNGLLGVVSKLLDLWREYQLKEAVRRQIQEDIDRRDKELADEAEAIDEAIERLRPDHVPDGMLKYRRD